MTLVVVLLGVAVAILTLLVLSLFRSHAEIIRALHRAGIAQGDHVAVVEHLGRGGLGGESSRPGSGVARDIVGVSPGGGPTKVTVTGEGRLTLLAFLSSGCPTCERFWKALAEPDLELPDARARLVIVGQDPAYESESAFVGLVPTGVQAVLSSAAWQEYDVPGSPYFALVDGTDNRLVGAGTATTWEQMRGILQQALGDYGREVDRYRGRSSGRDRSQRADEALLAAGIGPGHPSLDPDSGSGDRNETPEGETIPEP